MDQQEALVAAADKAAVLRTWSYDELTRTLLGKCESTQITAASGTSYLLEATADQEEDEDLRVVVSVVGGPTETFVMRPDGTFVSED